MLPEPPHVGTRTRTSILRQSQLIRANAHSLSRLPLPKGKEGVPPILYETASCLHSPQVKCDRTLPTCRACNRLRLRCPGYGSPEAHLSQDELQSSVSGIFRASGVEKRRVGSCEACHKSKTRCSKTRPTCLRCQQRRIPCIYPDKYKPISDDESSTPLPPSSMQNSPSPVTLVNRKLSTHVNFAQDAELEQVANDFQW